MATALSATECATLIANERESLCFGAFLSELREGGGESLLRIPCKLESCWNPISIGDHDVSLPTDLAGIPSLSL
jgi:hypothetical protein